MTNFESFGLSNDLNESLFKMNYTEPTPIQEKAIPLAMQGHDILGSAQTGTGKTAAFSIPLVEALLRSPHGTALVLTPTRELAKQVLSVIHQLLGDKSDINTAFIIGGEPMPKQLKQLRNNPRIIVGTPGRINDHLQRRSMTLDNAHFLVLDETDRMLDMGFGVQLDKIIKHLPEERQTLMFSATLPDGIVRISNKYLTNPQRVSVGETNVIAVNIKQEIIHIEQPDKYQELLVQLNERTGSVIVFVKTKHGADRVAKNLRRDGFEAEALHGDLKQNKRDKVMKNFRDMRFRILIATDIAARGLDVPHIEHVINHDLPQVAEDYIHRMGRTARAGAEGSAVCFISSQDGRKWHAIERLLDPSKSKSSNDRDQKNTKHRRKSFTKPFKSKSGGHKSPNTARKTYDDKPSQGKPAHGKSGQKKPYHGRPTQDKPAQGKPAQGNSTQSKPYKERSEQRQSSQGKSYQGKSSQGDAGQGKLHRKGPSQGKPNNGKPAASKHFKAGPNKSRSHRAA
jgi:ATP-dependent RNA helicase DeaD